MVRSYLFELAREKDGKTERGMKVACEPASARLSLQATRLTYFKNSNLSHHCREIKRCESVAYRSYFTNKSFQAVRSLRDL